VCGYDKYTELHHEEDGKRYTLCKNHHKEITMNNCTIEELIEELKLSVSE